MPRKRDFNKTHPELRRGEVFVTNSFLLDEGSGPQFGYDSHLTIRLRTKRVGQVAYDIHGRRLARAVPVFALKSEYEKKKDRLWK